MLVIILAAFLQVETRLALGHSGYMRARLNAIASAKMALGQLQQLAGPDQRVTMRADMYDAGKAPGAENSSTVPQTGAPDTIYNPSAPKDGKLSHQKRYWTGVWATGGVDSTKVRDWDVMNPHKSRLFLGWLSSPCYISTSAPYDTAEYNDPTKPLPNYLPNSSYFTSKSQSDGVFRNELNKNDGQVLIDDLANNISNKPDSTLVPLLSRGSVKFPAVANTSRGALEYYGQVDALPVPLPGPNSTVSSGINGRYAFWIGDEGIKAKANLPDAYATIKSDGTGYTTPLEAWDDGLRGSAAQRNAIELINGKDLKDSSVFPSGFSWDTWRTTDVGTSTSWNTSKLARVTNTNSLILWANTVGGTAAGDVMKDATKALFHDVTALSYSTITDTYNGGIKLDLSTAFELPYTTFRGLEMSYGQKSDTKATPVPADRITALFHGASNRSRPTTAGGGGFNATDLNIDFNRPYTSNVKYMLAVPTAADLLKFSPRAAEWAATYVGKGLSDTRYSDLTKQNGNEEPERMGFVYEVPLRSAFWKGDVKRINPYTSTTDGTEGELTDYNNLNARVERGPTWDLYRNYYRMYKMEIEQCHFDQPIRGQDKTNFSADNFKKDGGYTLFAHGVEPLSTSTIRQTYPYSNQDDYVIKTTFTQGPYGWLKNKPDSRGNLSFYQNYATQEMGPQYRYHAADWSPTSNSTTPTIPWPTSMKLTPSILRFAFMYSTLWKNGVLGVAVDPFIIVHNPYDCAIEFPGITMATSEQEVTHLFQFSINGVQIGDVFTAYTYSQARPFSFRAIAGENGNDAVFRLEPGEIQVITAAPANPTELSGYNSIEIAGQFKKKISLTESAMFLPMDPFSHKIITVRSYGTDNKPVATTTAITKDPTEQFIKGQFSGGGAKMIADVVGSKGYYYLNSKDGTETKKTYTPIITAIPDWEGDFATLWNNPSTINITVFNYNGDTFGSYSINKNGYGNVFGTRKNRGSGHIVDGGSQKWSFYLQYPKDFTGKEDLSPTRRWSGPIYEYANWLGADGLPATIAPAYTNLIDGSQSVYQMYGVDEPLILSFRGLSSGWPAYGNAANEYLKGKEDPEFKGKDVLGFKEEFSQSLILSDNGQKRVVYKTAEKQPFFILDFFVRGAKETKITDTKIYPSDPNVKNSAGNSVMVTPEELLSAPMSPFAFSTRAQLAGFQQYDGKSHAPIGWVASQRSVDSNDPMIPFERETGKGYWGNSALIKTEGNSKVILFPIPRRPLLSLSQLGSASTTEVSIDPDLSVGSSFAHPGIKDLTKVCDWPGTKGGSFDTEHDPSIPEHGYAVKVESGGESTKVGGVVVDPETNQPTTKSTGKSVRGRTAVRTDVAFASNLALWDSYWLSGLNTQEPSYSDKAKDWPAGANLPTHALVKELQTKGLEAVKAVDNKSAAIDIRTMSGIKTALESGYNPLANKRVTYIPDVSKAPDTLTNTIFPNYLSFPHPSYLGRRSLYNGGFNVNSTSKAAWKAVLGAMKNQKMPDGVNTASGSFSTNIALTRFASAFGTNNGAKKPWECYHDITEDELDALAGAVVNEVRRRGPFMSLSDFVNRRLINDDNFGLKGALQAAIDATTINDSAIDLSGGTFETVPGKQLAFPYFPIKKSDRFPSARAMSKTNSEKTVVSALGAPGIISQMDILNSVGPNLTARSDTFIIRAYGEAFDNNGQSIGKAWVEVVAQRGTDFVVLTDQQAQSLNVSAEPNIRAPAYRDNNPTANKSDYDAKPIVDIFQRNIPSDETKKRLINLNRLLGRRFKSVSTKWLNQQDI